jgi:putative ABC transport system permease protein
VSRAFSFLRTLALLSALIVMIGTVLYLQARQRGRIISYALARRMGLRSRSHLAALQLELGAMLLTSALAGVSLGLAAALLLYARIDPLPSMAPSPLLRLAPAAPAALMVVLAAITFVGALFAHRTAEHAHVAEQLRQAG